MRIVHTLLLFSLGAFASGQVPSYVPTDGLLGWWPFNGNANDESGNGNNGTVHGALLTADRDGSPNSAYAFNGLDQNVDGNIGGLTSLLSSTLTAWVNYSGNAGGQAYDAYFQLGQYGNHTFAYGYESGSQNLNLYSFCLANVSPIPSVDLNNDWHFVAIVDSLDTARIYVDGILLASGTGGGTGDCFQGSAYFQIAGGSDGQWLTGAADDIGFWNRGLSQAEIDGLYAGVVDVGIEQPTSDASDLFVYPNPASGSLNLETELQGLVSLVVADGQGRQVHSETFIASGARTRRVIDIGQIATGAYSLALHHASGTIRQIVLFE